MRTLLRRLSVLAVLSACTLEPPFERSNPFDPGSPYPMRLVGVPDTVFAIGQRFQASIERDPPIDQSALSIQWRVTDPNDILAPATQLQHLFNGEFLATNAMSAELKTLAVGARFNEEVVVGRSLIVGQLVDTLRLACGSAAAPVACNSMPLAVGATLTVRSTSRDARGFAVQGLQHAMARATVTLRTPGILSSTFTPNTAGTYTFAAVAAGTTWLIIRSDRAVDSVQVTVSP